MALSSSDQCFSPSLSFTACISLLVPSHRKVSFLWKPILWRKDGDLLPTDYVFLKVDSFITDSSMFGAGPHSGNYSWLCFPPDNMSSKRFFRDCSNGPAIHCEMVLNEIAFIWQLYSKSKKGMKYWMKIIFSGCTLWKTLLGNAYHRKLTCQVLKY